MTGAPDEDPKEMEGAKPGFVIAALGASAGGLEPLETFFKHMPADAGIAFVIIQHLAPDHPTALPQLLGRHTRMPVEQAQDQTEVVPNQVYVIPPNATLTIEKGLLRVAAPAEARGARTPIDGFFSSLAEDCGEHAVCIMFSGTGTDGTLGLRAIKEYGGMAMAQTLDSAKYDAILRSAIATGLVDHVLPAEEMPAKLMDYAAHLASVNGNGAPDSLRAQIAAHMSRVHAILRRRAGHDFSQYKENTIARRLERRMKALQIETVEQYVQALDRQPEEAERLFNDLLIGVTQFFRDAEAFAALQAEVIPKLFEGRDKHDQVRVSVMGCATGEEAYSIAILLSEYASTLDHAPKMQIFATDIDEGGLATARKGRYPESIAEHVTPERLERFFSRQDGGWQVNRELREIVLFSVHSFLKDPPFSRLDLISCRNVMIYLGQELQKKLIPLFHYALRPGGYLFLGPSESASSHKELFGTVDKKHRIFERKETLPRPAVAFPLGEISRPNQAGGKSGAAKPPDPAEERDLPRRLERIILQRYRPACVTVKENGDAVYFSGRLSRYLDHPTGSPDVNLVNMAREGLRIPLRTALHRAATARERVVQKQISVQTNGTVSQVDLTVEPLAEFQAANLYMVVFEEAPPSAGPPQASVPAADANSEETIRHLEDELRSAQEHAQAMFEELESSNEELKSANEEYQSTNEELETSKEELQSFNEELQTVNTEISRKSGELDNANSDLQNLLNSTEIATIFLDGELRIKTFTPAAGAVFRLIAGDVGRPITDLAAQFADVELVPDIRETLRTLKGSERQLAGKAGRYYQLRVLPYRTVKNVIDGVVLTFTDVTQAKQATLLVEDAERRRAAQFESLVRAAPLGVYVVDADFRIRQVNDVALPVFGDIPGLIGRDFDEVIRILWPKAYADEITGRFRHTLETGESYSVPERGEKRLDRGVTEYYQWHIARTQLPDDRNGVVCYFWDISAEVQGRDDIAESREALRGANEDLKHFSYAASHDLQEPLRMVMSYTQLLAREYKGRLGPEADKYIALAVDGAERMEALLTDLREYWSVNEQKVEHLVPVDCNSVLDKTLAYLEISLRESGGAVTHDSLPVVIAEEVPLATLFQNLIGNAIKYRRRDTPPRIRVSAARHDNAWEFSVADNGIGIEAEHLETIFGPFKRLHGREYPGTGLGLAMCQKIVERYGGRIWVESTYGQGSVFHFALPARNGDV